MPSSALFYLLYKAPDNNSLSILRYEICCGLSLVYGPPAQQKLWIVGGDLLSQLKGNQSALIDLRFDFKNYACILY